MAIHHRAPPQDRHCTVASLHDTGSTVDRVRHRICRQRKQSLDGTCERSTVGPADAPHSRSLDQPLILSRLFGSAGNLSDQLEGTIDYRRIVKEIADVAVSPNEPSAFIGLLAETLKRRVQDFRQEVESRTVSLNSG